jgi:hypothetical protein
MQEKQNGGRAGEFERVSALREETLGVLDRCSRGEYVASDIIVALRHAADELAKVEDALRLDALPELQPAPIADA